MNYATTEKLLKDMDYDSNDALSIQNSISSTEESSLIDNVLNAEGENQTEDSNIIGAEELADTLIREA